MDTMNDNATNCPSCNTPTEYGASVTFKNGKERFYCGGCRKVFKISK